MGSSGIYPAEIHPGGIPGGIAVAILVKAEVDSHADHDLVAIHHRTACNAVHAVLHQSKTGLPLTERGNGSALAEHRTALGDRSQRILVYRLQHNGPRNDRDRAGFQSKGVVCHLAACQIQIILSSSDLFPCRGSGKLRPDGGLVQHGQALAGAPLAQCGTVDGHRLRRGAVPRRCQFVFVGIGQVVPGHSCPILGIEGAEIVLTIDPLRPVCLHMERLLVHLNGRSKDDAHLFVLRVASAPNHQLAAIVVYDCQHLTMHRRIALATGYIVRLFIRPLQMQTVILKIVVGDLLGRIGIVIKDRVYGHILGLELLAIFIDAEGGCSSHSQLSDPADDHIALPFVVGRKAVHRLLRSGIYQLVIAARVIGVALE